MARDRSDIKVTASDALEFEPVEHAAPKPRRRGLKLVIALLVLGGIAGAGWVVYGERLMAMVGSGDGEVPLIHAETGPVKVRPENPGGLQVPNRDKLVYNRLSGSEDGVPPVERLLPRPESPKPMPMPKVGENDPPADATADHPKTARVPSLADVKSVTPPPPAPPPAAGATRAPIKLSGGNQPLSLRKGSEPAATAAAPAPAAQPKPKVSAAPPPPPAAPQTSAKTTEIAKAAPVPSAPAAAPDNKVFRVQLAAARTPEAARAEWDRVRRKNLDLLGDLGLTVTKVDLGPKKGVFYRLRVGPLANDADARKLCGELAKRRIGCLVIKPGA